MFAKFLGKLFCRTLPSSHFSRDVVFFLVTDQGGLQPEINLSDGAMGTEEKQIHKPVQSCVVIEIRWKRHCQIVATHVPAYAYKVKEKGELKDFLKWGIFSFYVMVNGELFTYLINNKWVILIYS